MIYGYVCYNAGCEAVKSNDSQQTNKRDNKEELETWTSEKKTRDVGCSYVRSRV